MPFYSYKCLKCLEVFETFHGFQEQINKCDLCEQEDCLEKVINKNILIQNKIENKSETRVDGFIDEAKKTLQDYKKDLEKNKEIQNRNK